MFAQTENYERNENGLKKNWKNSAEKHITKKDAG
jgi:hypothetical protein